MRHSDNLESGEKGTQSTKTPLGRVLMTAFLIGMLLAACADDQAETTTPGDTDTTVGSDGTAAATTEARSESDVVEGGIFRMGIVTSGPAGLNPFGGPAPFYSYIYPGLVDLGHNGELVGSLAESWESTDGGLTWTFKLKEGGWSDGTPLTAEDVAWTGNIIIEYVDGPTGWQYFPVVGVSEFEAVDDHTVVVRNVEPRADTPARFTFFYVLPKHIWEEHEGTDGTGLAAFQPELELPTVSGGAYTITEFDPRGTSVLEPNEHFYGGQTYADAVGIQVFENDDAMVRALQVGDINVARVSGTAVDALESTDGITILTRPSDAAYGFGFNSNPDKTSNPELADPAVREAISHAINRDEIIEIVYGGYGGAQSGIIAPSQSAWLNPDREPSEFDLDLANQILDDAGYEVGPDGIRIDQDGEPMEYTLVGGAWHGTLRLYELIADSISEIGIRLIPEPLDYASYVERISQPDGEYLDYDVSLAGDSGIFGSDDYMLSTFTCDAYGGGYTYTAYCNPDYEELFVEQSHTIDPEARRALVWEMEEMVVDRDMAFIPTVVPDGVFAISSDWTGANIYLTRSNMPLNLHEIHMVSD